MSSNVLVNSLQRYGQNERSLFSFLNDDTDLSIRKNSQSFFGVSNVYDYLINSLATEINSGDSNSSTQTTILNNLRPEQGITEPIQPTDSNSTDKKREKFIEIINKHQEFMPQCVKGLEILKETYNNDEGISAIYNKLSNS